MQAERKDGEPEIPSLAERKGDESANLNETLLNLPGAFSTCSAKRTGQDKGLPQAEADKHFSAALRQRKDLPRQISQEEDMTSWRADALAVSRAGHDRDTLYVVLEEDRDYVLLSDGRRRPLEKPKKKKKMHVQLIRKLPEEILEPMECITLDAHVRKILKSYKNIRFMEGK